MLDDDLGHALGDVDERLLSAALYYRNNGECPAVASSTARALKFMPDLKEGAQLQDTRTQTLLKNNRILMPSNGVK